MARSNDVSGIRLTLGLKLAGGLCGLVALSLCLGLFALERMSTLNTAVGVVSGDALPSSSRLGMLAYSIQELRRSEYRLEVSAKDDPEELAATFKLIDDNLAEVHRLRTVLEPFIDDGEERQRYTQEFDRLLPIYENSLQQQINSAKAGDAATILSRIRAGRTTAYNPLMDFVKWDLKYNRSFGEHAAAQASAGYTYGREMLIAGLVLVLLLSVALSLFLIRHIGTATARLAATMRTLANGDTAVIVPASSRDDEIGEMASAVEVFRDNMIRARELSEAQQAEQAIKLQRSQALEALVGSFEIKVAEMVNVLAAASTELEATAKEMSVTVENTGRQSLMVADAARDADQGVQSVAAATEELSSSIREITEQVAAGAKRADLVADDAKRTDGVVTQLAEASTRVGQIVDLIAGIAAQTNLLALNATIEAARAGDAGKGFAVVASEVKGLAQQTAKATEGVGEQVAQIRKATEAAVAALASIAAGITDINRSSVMIAAAVEEQGAATGEIARNVQQTAGNTRTVTENIVEVSRSAQSNGAAATQVMASAGELSRQAETLNHEVKQFLRLVKSA